MVKIIGEIGINHNGSVDIAKKLILLAKTAGCDYVKFQKRNPDVCVPDKQKNVIRDTPWGKMSYLDYKYKLEFGEKEFQKIDEYCNLLDIKWFSSVWDMDSVDFMVKNKFKAFDGTLKISSALITNIELCVYARKNAKRLIISTGMSNEKEILGCINNCNPDIIMHTNSTYPTPVEELNFNYIKWLKEKYPNKEIGYSGHEYGLVTTFATVSMGVTWIERHITLDRTMWGSDQFASIEPSGLIKLVRGIKDIEKALSIPVGERIVFGGELEKLKSLRK
ncbi:MAG: N-acetylneuraminate synthase family protein [bacterium]